MFAQLAGDPVTLSFGQHLQASWGHTGGHGTEGVGKEALGAVEAHVSGVSALTHGTRTDLPRTHLSTL